MGRRIAAMDPALCDPCVMKSRVGKHWSGAQNPRDTLFKGRNIQELSVGTHQPCIQSFLAGGQVKDYVQNSDVFCQLGRGGGG